MSSSMTTSILLIGLMVLSGTRNVLGYRVNITLFDNCKGHGEAEVELLSVEYACDASGVCDTVHGVYEIYESHQLLGYEMWMTINKCARGTTGLCRDNEQKFVESMHCERFDGDQEGPWYMISQATEHETCGAAKGKFNLSGATMRAAYLDPYIAPVDPQMPRYRIEMLFHKTGASVESEKKHIRGCVDLELELIF